MNRQTYSDNVDSNGESYKTVGDNIRYGSKSAESVVKALQSDDITFDMQAIMNVLPFMDSTKKIVEVNISAYGNAWHCDKYERSPSAYGVGINIPSYGYLIGEFNRGAMADANKLRYNIVSSPVNSINAYVLFQTALSNTDDTTGVNLKLYIVTDK